LKTRTICETLRQKGQRLLTLEAQPLHKRCPQPWKAASTSDAKQMRHCQDDRALSASDAALLASFSAEASLACRSRSEKRDVENAGSLEALCSGIKDDGK
jgi:hypothetical protein